jgi:hypothetical protein
MSESINPCAIKDFGTTKGYREVTEGRNFQFAIIAGTVIWPISQCPRVITD